MIRMLTVEEAESMLKDFHIKMPHQVIRRWLYKGLIEGKPLDKSKIDWEIPEYAIVQLILDPPEDYITPKYTSDDPRISKLHERILQELNHDIAKLQDENVILRKEFEALKRERKELNLLLGIK